VLGSAYDIFLATGTLTRRYLAVMGVPESRIGQLPYAIDVDHFRARAHPDAAGRQAVRSRYGIPSEARVVLAVSKLNAREAPRDLIRAFAGMNEPTTWLIVVGDGPARAELESHAGQPNVSRIVFTGYVPYADLPSLYGAADLFVHVPREERWGVSVAEALASGVPVVASRVVGAAHDLVVEGQNGFLCDQGDVAGLGRSVTAALALDREAAAVVTSRILEQWDYASAWRGLLDAATQARRLRAA
jgi:glycosyltransferase involved in cell wall biosynthesis